MLRSLLRASLPVARKQLQQWNRKLTSHHPRCICAPPSELLSLQLLPQRVDAHPGLGPDRHRFLAAKPRAAATQDAVDEGEDEYEELEELSEARHLMVQQDFLPFAAELRGEFDRRFKQPRSNAPERFIWDYWYVAEQYNLVRTQAQVFFPQEMYSKVEDALLSYGEQVLGCRAISPIWLSYYVDGCCQELHADNPHGPFAFVLSLTRWDTRRFTGGETIVLQPDVLDYWNRKDLSRGLELRDLTTLVEPLFNQLLVFDPRLPHGVRPVRGTRDPLEARLVLHGWFTEPSPFFTGPLTERQAGPALAPVMDGLLAELAELPPVAGTLTARLSVSGADGSVGDVKFLADTLVPLAGGGANARAAAQHAARDFLLSADFPPAPDGGGDSTVTVPLIFQ